VIESLGVEVGETVLFRLNTITGQANVGEFTIAGVYPDNRSFNITGGYAGLSYLNSLLGLEHDEFQVLNIKLLDLENIDVSADSLYGELKLLGEVESRESDEGDMGPGRMMSRMFGSPASLSDDEEAWAGTKFSVSTLNDMMEPILSLVQMIDMIRVALFIILLVIIMVGLLNTFRMVLIERTQEIGTMRAIGMQRSGVRNIFLLEALFLALVGAVAGLAAALIFMGVLGNIQIDVGNVLQLFTRNGKFAFPFVTNDVVTTVLIIEAVTLISAWFPARKAARLKPADALRTSY
jgi:putative ABC transport system permease protein